MMNEPNPLLLLQFHPALAAIFAPMMAELDELGGLHPQPDHVVEPNPHGEGLG